MFRTKLSAGVEVNAGSVRIALLAPKPVPTVLKCEEILLQPGDDQRVGHLVSQALTRMGAEKADVHLAFAPPQAGATRHQLFQAPKLSRSELQAVALRELRKDGTFDPSQNYFAVDVVGASEGTAGQGYLAVALAKDPVDQLAAALMDGKHVVRSATSAALALYRAATVTGLASTGIVALALLEPRRSSLIVLENGVPRFFRDIPTAFVGGRDGADDTLMSQALARELDISLVYFAQQNRPKQVDTILVVGDARISERVNEWMEEGPNYKVLRFEGGAQLAVDASVTGSLTPYAAAIGAAMGQKAKSLPDLLPAELKGRPERLIAVVAAALVALVFVGITLALRQGHVVETERETARLERVRAEFTGVERQVERAAKVDAQVLQAVRWQEVFEDHDTYHLHLAQVLFGLPATIPAHGKLRLLQAADAPHAPLGQGQVQNPVPSPDVPNIRIHLEGLMRAGDLGSAQGDLRALVQATQKLPTVKTAELSPIKAPAAEGGIIELPFTLDLSLTNAFPGPKR